MRIARTPGALPRSAALIALAALAVHQLRYRLAFGDDTGQELAHHGHAYLAQALPVLLAFAVATLAAGVLRAVLRPDASSGSLTRSFAGRALLYALMIMAVFSAQELLEGALFAGHPAGLAAVLAAGGWLALPLALVAGAAAALLDGGLVALGSLIVVRLRAAARPRPPRRHGAPRASAMPALASSPAAFGLARRPPPLAR
jgi:hypothetical protein